MCYVRHFIPTNVLKKRMQIELNCFLVSTLRHMYPNSNIDKFSQFSQLPQFYSNQHKYYFWKLFEIVPSYLAFISTRGLFALRTVPRFQKSLIITMAELLQISDNRKIEMIIRRRQPRTTVGRCTLIKLHWFQYETTNSIK